MITHMGARKLPCYWRCQWEPRCSPKGKPRTARNWWKARPTWRWIERFWCQFLWWKSKQKQERRWQRRKAFRCGSVPGRFSFHTPPENHTDKLTHSDVIAPLFTTLPTDYTPLYIVLKLKPEICTFCHWPWEGDCHYSLLGSVQPSNSDSAVSRQP